MACVRSRFGSSSIRTIRAIGIALLSLLGEPSPTAWLGAYHPNRSATLVFAHDVGDTTWLWPDRRAADAIAADRRRTPDHRCPGSTAAAAPATQPHASLPCHGGLPDHRPGSGSRIGPRNAPCR